MMNNKYVVGPGAQTILRGVHWCTASRREDRGALCNTDTDTPPHCKYYSPLPSYILICHMSFRQHTTHNRQHTLNTNILSYITIMIYQGVTSCYIIDHYLIGIHTNIHNDINKNIIISLVDHHLLSQMPK